MSCIYVTVPWAPGAVTLYREGADPSGRLEGALLTLPDQPSERRMRALDPLARPVSDALLDSMAERLARYLGGEPVTFPLEELALERCGPFQTLVLRAEHAIPRGRLSTYGRIAARIGHPRAARAVGTALGNNPFPILIPCHRAVRSDGSLGGYAGGLDMKRILLALEGVPLGPDGRAPTDRFVY
ncbi:MAG: methylated-DNA--[protein]-cysteine S-methyltransferase [Anaerolineae bacterium]